MRRLSILLTLIPSVLFGQITLQDYRSAVVNYSRDLQMARSDVVKAEENVAFTKLSKLPNLSLSGSYSQLINNVYSGKDWRFNLQPQVIQTIYSGGGVKASIDQSQTKYNISICNEEFTYLEVIYAADYAYWSVVATKRYRNAMREYVNIITSLKDVVDRRFSEGYTSKGDVLMIASRLSEAEYQLISSEQSYAVAKHNFNILRGVDSNSDFLTLTINSDTFPLIPRVSIADIINARPDYEAVRLNIDLYENITRSVNAVYMPQIKLSLNANWQTLTPPISNSTHIDGAAIVSISVPVFNFNARKRAVAVSQQDVVKSTFAAELLIDTIQKEESNGWTSLQESYSQLKSARKSLAIASENLKISTYSYEEGVSTILDVMQAQISWIQLYSNAISSEYNYLTARSLYCKITANIAD